MKARHLLCVVSAGACLAAGAGPISVGERRELFVDDFLIESRAEGVEVHVHRPAAKEVVLTADAPWEGNTSGYFTVFEDEGLCRMYYRGGQHDAKDNRKAIHEEVTCYAESRDGIRFEKPKLGLFEWDGNTDNNIIWTGPGTHNFTPFRDANPDAKPEARYKAFGRTEGGAQGLLAFHSGDGVRWKLSRTEPVITAGAFDSQNLAFWDSHRGEYRAYWRIFTDGKRAIRTATSKDFLAWESQADLRYSAGTPQEHLYTNAVQPYFRAPHLLVGFPTRYLPDDGQRVEPVFMASRDGVQFTRYAKAVIPEDAPEDRKGNRSNYMAWGMVHLPGKPDEISVYATEAYYGPVPGRVRRFVYRVDGFVSLRGTGQVTTKPLTFSGTRLRLNHDGRVRVELLDGAGDPVPGLATELDGDKIDAEVGWELAEWAGKPVRLRFTLEEADLYSMQFGE